MDTSRKHLYLYNPMKLRIVTTYSEKKVIFRKKTNLNLNQKQILFFQYI